MTQAISLDVPRHFLFRLETYRLENLIGTFT